MAAVSTDRLAEVLVELADTLVDEFDLIDFMQRVAERTAEVADVAAVGVLLADPHGRLQFVASSDEATRLLDLFQLQVDQGPCVDAYRQRSQVLNVDLREATGRWPSFAPEALSRGFLQVHAVPLRLRTMAIGALNLFSSHTRPLDTADLRVVQALADVTTIGLLQERAIRRGEVLTEQLQGALTSRVIIEQAKGVLSARRGVDVEEAFLLLRDHARRTRTKLVELALALVTDPDALPDLTGRP
jgi:GAF domain-containing protein